MVRFVSRTRISIVTKGNNSKVITFQHRGCIPTKKPSNNGNNGNKSICLGTMRHLRALLSFHCTRRFGTGSKRQNNPGGVAKTAKTSLILRIPYNAVICSTSARRLVKSLIDPSRRVYMTGNNGNKLNGHRFLDGHRHTPRRSLPNLPKRRHHLHLRLGLLTRINVVNLPGTNGSALVTSLSTTQPGVTSCPFAALVPGLKMIHQPANSNAIFTSVPKLVRKTRRKLNLNRRFLHRVRHAHLLLRLISTASPRPLTGCRAVRHRLTTCNRDLVSHPRVITLGGMSTLPPRNLTSLITRFRAIIPAPVRYVSTIAKRKLAPLLRRM